MLGFDKNAEDKGVGAFLSKTGFVPDSICALLFNPDFIHLHRGMKEEYALFPDNCAYRAAFCNTERYRQDWTNFELRDLTKRLSGRGIKFYAGIMGYYLNDKFHKEWLTDHPEIRSVKTTGLGDLMCLKRFADGSYYEDFFAEKLVEALVDYGMAGVHLSDAFCPSGHIFKSDYSTDMVEQFCDFTKEVLPPEIAKTLGDDGKEAVNLRHKYIISNKRRAWIAFYEWRWARFFKKICDAVHAVKKEVWILGMYCSDPHETRYVYGFNSKTVMEAGVDCITANILPTSVYFERPEFPYFFHRIHMDLPLLASQVDKARVLPMVSIHDASEEWSMIDHAPVLLERDVYTTTAYAAVDDSGARRASDGVFICLGDGVDREKWSFIKKRLDIGFATETEKPRSPLIFWSDYASEQMLDEYIDNKRTTPHKQSFEIFKAGTAFSGSVRSEYIGNTDAPLFVPNLDLLSLEERKSLASYKRPWVATAPAGYIPSGLTPEIILTDKYSDYPMSVMAFGFEVQSSKREELSALLLLDGGAPTLANLDEEYVHPPIKELPYTKLSDGFVSAMAELLRLAVYSETRIASNHPIMIQQLSSGVERIFIYNKYESAYVNALVESDYPIESAEIASDFPILPVKFVDSEDNSGYFDYEKQSGERKRFQVRLAPNGLTIVDIKRRK